MNVTDKRVVHDLPTEISSLPNIKTTKGDFVGKWYNPLPIGIIKRIEGKSWKEGCPVPLADLVYVQVTHWKLDYRIGTGELICHKNLAQEWVEIFRDLFAAHYPIEKMILIDDFDADDEQSMLANNSSALCYRPVTGQSKISMHSYGGTIDLNPQFNPYVKGEIIQPKNGEMYVDRDNIHPALIKKGDACYQAFVSRGYEWGGDWTSLKDYQHFQKKPEQFISST